MKLLARKPFGNCPSVDLAVDLGRAIRGGAGEGGTIGREDAWKDAGRMKSVAEREQTCRFQ